MCPLGHWRLLSPGGDTFSCAQCTTQCIGMVQRVPPTCDGTAWELPECVCIQDVPNAASVADLGSKQCKVTCGEAPTDREVASFVDTLDVSDTAMVSRVYVSSEKATRRMSTSDASGIKGFAALNANVFLFTVDDAHAVFSVNVASTSTLLSSTEYVGRRAVPWRGCQAAEDGTTACQVSASLPIEFFNEPRGVVTAGTNTLFVADTGNLRVLRLDLDSVRNRWDVRVLLTPNSGHDIEWIAYSRDDGLVYAFARNDHRLYSLAAGHVSSLFLFS